MRSTAVVRVAVTTSSFLLAYSVLTMCHAFGRDPRVVVALARIPLFGRVAASAIACAPFGVAAPTFVRDRRQALRAVPVLLGASIVAALATILWGA
ncbi:MAG TPA: hypothetical protein VLT58_11210 [Polyangia bacterium]|nr:hypothetical protein [Polyangia bacterium]